MALAPDTAIEENSDVNPSSGGFSVHLANFDGPFDLLLQLISRHKMDVTEVALSIVTDEFISFIRELEASGAGWDLDQATEFLVVAATLLDLKAARLLPSGEVEDEEDLALLEARDLLFARLLQYRAFKEIAATFGERILAADKSFPRVVALDPALASLLPEVLIGVGAQRFAAIAERVLTPKVSPVVAVEHLHMPLVSVTEEWDEVIAEALGVPVTWLVYGKEERALRVSEPNSASYIPSMTEEEAFLIRAYRAASGEARTALLSMAKVILPSDDGLNELTGTK